MLVEFHYSHSYCLSKDIKQPRFHEKQLWLQINADIGKNWENIWLLRGCSWKCFFNRNFFSLKCLQTKLKVFQSSAKLKKENFKEISLCGCSLKIRLRLRSPVFWKMITFIFHFINSKLTGENAIVKVSFICRKWWVNLQGAIYRMSNGWFLLWVKSEYCIEQQVVHQTSNNYYFQWVIWQWLWTEFKISTN